MWEHLTFSHAAAWLIVIAFALYFIVWRLIIRPIARDQKRRRLRRIRRAGQFVDSHYIDRARTTNQFHVPSALVDRKGVFKP
jgi:hypothetical protein